MGTSPIVEWVEIFSKEKNMKLQNKFYKSRKVQAWSIIIISILAEIGISLWYNFSYNIHAYFPEVLYYVSQFITSIFVISGVVIAVWQYYLSSKSARDELEIKQVQRAIDLSEYYKDNILKYAPAIKYIFQKSGIKDILDVLFTKELKDFDMYELESIFTQSQIDTLRQIQDSNSFYNIVIDANTIYHLGSEITLKEFEEEENGEKKTIVKYRQSDAIVAYMSDLVNRVLNNMEYFALHFRYQAADESVVYQSLHQTYLELVPYLYYYIAKQNTNPSNRLYTNVSWLYINWKSKKDKQNADRSDKASTIPSHGTVVGNR